MEEENYIQTKERLWSDVILSRVIQQIKEYKYVISSCFLFGFLAYMFVFTNKLVNWDELNFIFSKGATIESGRWGLELLAYMIPNYSMPWIFGCMTLFCITVSVCLIVRTFQIESPSLQIVLSGAIIVFPSLIGTFAYMFTSSSYGVAFLLAIVAFTLLARSGWRNYLWAGVCIVFSCSIYQSYVMVLSSLLLVLMIQRIMYSDISIRQIVLQGISFLLCIGVAMGVYYILTRAINHVTQIPMGGYAEHALDSKDTIAERIQSTYRSLFGVLFQNEKGLIPRGISQYAHLLLLVFSVLECIIWMCMSKDWKKCILLALVVMLLPVSIFGMYLITATGAVHLLVLYSFIAIYVWAVVLLDGRNWGGYLSLKWNRCRKFMCNAVILGVLVIIGCNISLANEAYLKLHLTHQNMISFSTALIAQLNAIPGYTHETPVAFVGEYDTPDFYDEFGNLDNMIGFPTLTPNWRTMYRYCGYDMNLLPEEEAERMKDTAQVKEMPTYPDHGCIQMVNNTVVVKFSE